MKVIKSKVFVLPESLTQAERDSICPCPICMEKMQREEGQYNNLQEVKSSIEQILNSTSLFSKDFQIDISYSPGEPGGNVYTDKTVIKKCKEVSDVSKHAVYIKKWVDSFEQHYRHPLMCELRENNNEIIANLNVYLEKYKFEAMSQERLFHLQHILSRLSVQSEILLEIMNEDFLDSKRILEVIQKTREARKESGRKLKEAFIYSLTVNSFTPPSESNDFSAEYGYE